MKRFLVILLLGFFLVIVIYVVAVLSSGRTTFFGKASTVGVFNASNSYIFVSPVTGSVGGENLRITVFVLDDRGRGIAGKNVLVSCKQPPDCQNSGVVFKEVQAQTDTLGRALYDISSAATGTFEIQASAEGITIPQTVTVVFR